MLLADELFFLCLGQLGMDGAGSHHAEQQEQWKAAADHVVRLPADGLGSSGGSPAAPFADLPAIKRADEIKPLGGSHRGCGPRFSSR